jgi:flagellar export protein FliJ
MKKFRFTLEPLKIVRERKEREALERYAQVLAEHSRTMERLGALNQELIQAQSEIKQRLTTSTPVTQIIQQQLYCAHLSERIKTVQNEIIQIEQKIKLAMQAVLSTRHEREVVDKFLANQRAAYDRELTLEEQKAIDELAGRRLAGSLSWSNQSYE